jgi:glycosyltransferase involved in cell wall biosynthesis
MFWAKRAVISVLLPFRNAASTLDDAISSVVADMREVDELVLVDDGSTDAGATIAERHARDPRVIRVTTPGLGLPGALARGLEVCRGSMVARMDADDISLPGRFAAQRALLDRDPSLGAVATLVEPFGDPGPGMERYLAWQNALVTAEEHARAIFVEAPVCHPSVMLRRSALDAVGGFRAGEFAEDYDLWLRLVDAGWGIAKVPEVLFRYRVHRASMTWNDPRLTLENLRKLRARHLAVKLERLGKPFALWGAGACGRRLARELETYGPRPEYFIDIDPKKIGRTARARSILAMDEGLVRARREGLLVIVGVAAAGARELIRVRLDKDGFVEGRDYFFAA